MPGTFDNKAMIVFTDGLQNRPKSIQEVSSSINNKTFAIGLGTETQVNTLELHNITQGSGGYLLLSDLISANIDDSFRLQKYFMQILANVTNTQIVKDPTGYINIGNKIKIPFQLAYPDINCRVIALSQYPFVKLSVEAPDGQIITPDNAAAYNVEFDTNNQDTNTCRFVLPIQKDATKNHIGKWFAILEIDEKLYKKTISGNERTSKNIRIKGSKYCVSVHSYSNLRMNARLDQSGMNPGNGMTVRAAISEYTVPLQRAGVIAHVTKPDHSVTKLLLNEEESGIYSGSIIASMSGIYQFHIIANGVDYKANPFTREQILNGAVFHGGDRPVLPVSSSTTDLCSLIKCFLGDKGVQAYLKEKKINPKNIHECLCKNENAG